MENDERFMELALKEAEKAMELEEVPIGAVIVQGNRVLSCGYNQVEGLRDPTAHAEILAIRKATQKIGQWRLLEATLYVTVEPCCMCLGAIILARIKRVVYGAKEPKMGFCDLYPGFTKWGLHRNGLVIESGVQAGPAKNIMQTFFSKLRRGTEVWP